MKTILIFLTIFILASCCPKKQEVKKEDNFLKVYEYTDDKYSNKENTINDNESYWWILAEEKDSDLRINTFIKQNHSYFSYAEAKLAFEKDDNKKYFILNFIKVDKETYEHNVGE